MSYITRKLNKLRQKETYVHFWQTLKYAFYVIWHPADGFWDLIHAKRGSYAAANFIVILSLLTHVWKLQFTNFVIMNVNWNRINIFMEMATIILPLAIFCICNWGVTTLFDGKGHLGDIYMGTAYAMTPYPLIQLPLIIASNFVTREEASFYWVFSDISFVWVYNFYSLRNACIRFHYAPVLQYDFAGCCIFYISRTRSNLQVELTGEE